MASIKALRANARLTRELQEARVQQVKDAVEDIMKSPTFAATVVEHPDQSVEALADAVVNRVVEVVADATSEFLRVCTARGIKKSDIRRAVGIVNQTFGLTDSEDYEIQLKAVAEYLRLHPTMYDDIVLISGGKIEN